MPPSRRRRAPSGARESQSPTSPGGAPGSDAEPEHYSYQEMVDHLRKVRSSSGDQGLKSKKKRRRRSNQPIREKRKRRLMMMGMTLLIVLPIIAFIIGSFIFSYMSYSGERFRKEMSSSVSELIGYRGEFEDPFKISKLAIKNRKYTAVGPDDSVLAGFALTNTEARLRFSSFFSKDWSITHLVTDRAELQFRPITSASAPPVAMTPVIEETIKVLAAGLGFSGVPENYAAERISCRHFNATFGSNPDHPHSIEGVHVTMSKTSSGYLINADRGKLKYFYWPEFTVENAEMAWSPGGILKVHRATLVTEDGGKCIITGQLDLSSNPTVDLAMDVENIKVDNLVNKTWDERVLGRMSGKFTLKGGLAMDSLPELHGKMQIPGLSVKNLEILTSLSINFKMSELKRIEFDSFDATIHQVGDTIRLSDIYGLKPSLAGLLGEFTVEPNHNVSGRMEIGLPEGTLTNAVDKQGVKKGRPAFFKSKPDGSQYGWAPFEVAGTLEMPTDNLERQFETYFGGEYSSREHRRTTTFERPQPLRLGPNEVYVDRLQQLFQRYVPTALIQ